MAPAPSSGADRSRPAAADRRVRSVQWGGWSGRWEQIWVVWQAFGWSSSASPSPRPNAAVAEFGMWHGRSRKNPASTGEGWGEGGSSSPLPPNPSPNPLPRGEGFGVGPAATFLALATLFLATPAFADLSICNRTSYVAEAALGIEQSGVRATRGWFRVEPGQCRTVLRGEIVADRLYLNARALPLYGSVAMTGTQGPELCAGSGDFLIARMEGCAAAGGALLPFAEVKPSGEGPDKVLNLAEAADYGEEQARLAAVQRLLGLLGYDPGPIDGTSGAKTEAALAGFLGDRDLPPEAAEAGLTARMLDALRAGEGAGLTWCNDTTFPVMAAFAREDGGEGARSPGPLVSTGWWRIEPGRCLRPDQADGAERARRLLSYALAPDATGAPRRRADGSALEWGGATTLCTRSGRFETREQKDCAARGYEPTGFAEVVLSKAGGATVRLRP